ncbi:MAG TPA: tetratricopeptide repeat-containing protein [Anaerolineales bacterium]|nr:tetratricopeptide repeat-containing protein [Anaerolineales bacterium]
MTQPSSTSAPQEPKPSSQTPPQSSPVPEETAKTAPVVKTLEPDAEPTSPAIHPEVRPHAFVIMPFGKKKGVDGAIYDFNAIYSQLIKPALERAGFEPFRADEETASGDILTDMFQELLLADLCIADMSIDNANVFYELGIRHAFRKRGVVHIQAGRAYMPFDVFNVRTTPYHITPEGVPDPAFLEKDKTAISRVTRDTWASDVDAVQSPIFNLLDGLVEPDRKSLETPLATGFWREYNEWKDRLAIAERQKRIGDILLLSEEIRNPLIKEEAIGEAGLALKNMGRHELALVQYRKGLEVNPRNLLFRREEAFHLNRLNKVNEAIIRIENLLEDTPRDTETVALLGRIYKEMWLESWRWIEDKDLRLQTAFDSYHWLLKSFQTYLRGYRLDLDEFYPGVNALTLGTILAHLADQFEDKTQPDPEIQEVRELLTNLRGSLIFALEAKTKAENADYWAFISRGELLILTAKVTQQVSRAYRKALTASRGNQFRLQSSLAQLEILRLLDIRAEFVQAGIDVIQEELKRIRKELFGEEKTSTPNTSTRQEGMVFLFTGYMVNNNRKQEDQFPPRMEDEIKAAIEALLDKYHAGPDDLAVTTGMDAGSEILFVECCVERGVPVQAYFPLFEGPYVREFVSPAGDGWQERFYKLRNDPLVSELYQPDCVGLPKEGDNVHERNNRWALYSALARGIDKVRLIALWDGKAEAPRDLDARLVRHMVDLMRDMGGIVEQINPAKLTRPLGANPDSNGKTQRKPGTRKKK